MAKRPWFKCYPPDWLAGVAGLSPAQRGIYTTILMLMYDNNGQITADLTYLARQCGIQAGPLARTLSILMEHKKLFKEGSMFKNKRTELEFSRRTEMAQMEVKTTTAKNDSRARINQKPESRYIDSGLYGRVLAEVQQDFNLACEREQRERSRPESTDETVPHFPNGEGRD